MAGVLANMGITRPSRWQLYFTLATMVAVLNGVAGGSAAAFGADLAGLPLAGAAGTGAAAGMASVAVSHRWQRWLHDQARQQAEVLFPSDEEEPAAAQPGNGGVAPQQSSGPLNGRMSPAITGFAGSGKMGKEGGSTFMRNNAGQRPADPGEGARPDRRDDLNRPDRRDRLAGMTVAELGGEAGLLEAVLALAERQAAAARSPFAALVVRGGKVAGVGVNTVQEDLDPSAHAEVCAIRDAARRVREVQLTGAVLYASCEPCAVCRTVAHAAGIADVVFAAPKELIPAAMGPLPDDTVRLIQAVASALPGQARPGATPAPDARLARPFTVFVASGGGR